MAKNRQLKRQILTFVLENHENSADLVWNLLKNSSMILFTRFFDCPEKNTQTKGKQLKIKAGFYH